VGDVEGILFIPAARERGLSMRKGERSAEAAVEPRNENGRRPFVVDFSEIQSQSPQKVSRDYCHTSIPAHLFEESSVFLKSFTFNLSE
jgi:hypothetical protein